MRKFLRFGLEGVKEPHTIRNNTPLHGYAECLGVSSGPQAGRLRGLVRLSETLLYWSAAAEPDRDPWGLAPGRARSRSLLLLVGLQLFKQIIRRPCGAATDLGVTPFDDFADLVHRHNLSAEDDRDLLA